MRSPHAPKARITGEACITHNVRIVFRKERITQKSLFCRQTKETFFGAAGQIRTADLVITNDALYRLSYSSIPLSRLCYYSTQTRKVKHKKYFFRVFLHVPLFCA